jgi:hypothetical protein
MLDICYSYALQHSISFNTDKLKCIYFKPADVKCDTRTLYFFAGGKSVRNVTSLPHLGYIVKQNQSDSECVTLKHHLLIGQINYIISMLGDLDPAVCTDLLQ